MIYRISVPPVQYTIMYSSKDYIYFTRKESMCRYITNAPLSEIQIKQLYLHSMSTDNSHPDSVLLFTCTLELLQIHKTHPGLILMYNMVINMVCINMIHYVSKETRFSRHVHHFSFISPCSTTEVYRTSRLPRPTGR